MAETGLGDFTATRRLIPIAALAVAIGMVNAGVAWGLLKLIAFFTNLFYFQRWSIQPASPMDHTLGWLSVLVPVAGGILIGFMARYGSERIRGHGIPEAMEAVLIHGSRVEPRVAVLKPVASAVAIGSGGPFGAEGPIIMTGGAFGSLIAQCFRLTSAERKTLLVAGAAAGMSAIFASPVGAVLLAVELLLFEWKPRSLVPVALASATAAVVRHFLLGEGPVFPVLPHAVPGVAGLGGCLAAGLTAGLLAALLTRMVYASEDLFEHRLRLHWMWWPAIGGLAIGLGGMICPRALGVGYETIAALLHGQLPPGQTLVLVAVKASIWALALGSGNSGGVLAPLLMMGGALGGLEAVLLPEAGPGFWAMIGMAAVLAGAMGAPLTAVVFTLELTHDLDALLPLLIASAASYAVAVLILKRSILTEKIARRGFHVSREYAIDPLEILAVEDVMAKDALTFPRDLEAGEALARLGARAGHRAQLLYPVLEADGSLTGIVTRSDLEALREPARPLHRCLRPHVVTVGPDDPLRVVVNRMAETGFTRLPVVVPGIPGRVVGVITLADLLQARAQHLEDERRRERILPLPFAPADPGTGS